MNIHLWLGTTLSLLAVGVAYQFLLRPGFLLPF